MTPVPKADGSHEPGPPANAPRWPAAMAPALPRFPRKQRGVPQSAPKSLAPQTSSPFTPSTTANPTTPKPKDQKVLTGLDVMARREQEHEDSLFEKFERQGGLAQALARERAREDAGDYYRRSVRRRDTGRSTTPSPRKQGLAPIPEETINSIDTNDWAEISAEIDRIGEDMPVLQHSSHAHLTRQEELQDVEGVKDISLAGGRYPGGRYIALTPQNDIDDTTIGPQTQPKQATQVMRYPTSRQQADYRDLLEGSEPEETQEMHKQGRWPTFQSNSEWPDRFTERYNKAIEIEKDQAYSDWTKAYHFAQRQGLNMNKEGLEEVKKMVSLGHDASERGLHKFNEELQVRARDKMMRDAGLPGRFGFIDPRIWHTKDSK
ncbi:hypothetical protein H2198_004107 [Neophaeococcomyces mojaviensis]|uniref:Uncharacterized protein n=1 Tax=Neophaeococcomyces mojaviensis TaxID=3383035 RepID=A0ACC3A9L5_9EURO|nr:hypothetical protein H2198_004107 [Knufia sp. JES_112]